MRALTVAATLGEKGGSFVGKIFMSEDLAPARAELRRHYETERAHSTRGDAIGQHGKSSSFRFG